MSGISACLVVYHEEAYIEDCLESFADLVDEILVIHDGPCSDATLTIARRYTDNVRETDRRTHCAEFIRPLALAECTKEWVLVIDADERLSPALRRSLRKLVAASDVDAYGFAWPYVNHEGQHVASRSVSSKKFLFRRSRMYTIGLPHMTPQTHGSSAGLPLEVYHVCARDVTGRSFRNLLQKNRRRGRAAAARVAEGMDRIETYNASLSDNRVKNVRKIRLLAKHPLLALLIIPPWGIFYWYLLQGYFRAGRIGLHDALNLPLYYASFALNLARLRRLP